MNSMIQKRAKVLAILAVVLLAFLAMRLPQQTRLNAQEISPFNPLFPLGTPDIQGSPMVGVAPGQTLRWSAVNIDSTHTCQEELSILDSFGNPVVPSTTVTLAPEAASFLDFRSTPSVFSRSQVRTVARELNNSQCAILLSVEVLDNAKAANQPSGRTRLNIR